jgi:hypothetical protein
LLRFSIVFSGGISGFETIKLVFLTNQWLR